MAAGSSDEPGTDIMSASDQLRLLGPELVAILRRHINLGYTPGAVTLVAIGRTMEVATAGEQARDAAAAAVRSDSIFRISSMTKPITRSGFGYRTRSTTGFPSSPIDACCAASAPRSMTRYPRSDPSPWRTC
jgi:hypothetical protein